MDAEILVVDDDAALAAVLTALLRQAGFAARFETNANAALSSLDGADLVISDLKMPGLDGHALLAAVRQRDPDLPVVMLTAHGTIPDAVLAMRGGAADFLLKPFDRDEILFVVRRVLSARDAREPTSTFKPVPSPATEDRIRRAASTSATVLVLGESGTGKERVARRIHQDSARRAAPFIAVHCAAIPENLLESELFGYEKGAFTGATHRKPGRVELANGGTLFLDEIGDLAPTLQVKLLRLLQERTYERLGGIQTLTADIRFVAATHRNLVEMVARGAFREDLYYRLAVLPIELPPLRERRDEIGPLSQAFCAELAETHKKSRMDLSADALALLTEQRWPGNIRQLRNFIERLVVLNDHEVIGAADVQRELIPVSEAGSAEAGLDEARRNAERRVVNDALKRANGNRTMAARLLGISRRTLYNKLAALDA